MAELSTKKRELFAQAAARGLSNKNAAIAAGYSARTASAAGCRLARDPEVKERVAELKAIAVEGEEEVAVALSVNQPVISMVAEAVSAAPTPAAPPAPLQAVVPVSCAVTKTNDGAEDGAEDSAMGVEVESLAEAVQDGVQVDGDLIADLVGLTVRGRRFLDAGLLTVEGFVVQVDGKVFDILANPKDQADLCRMGIISMDNQQRDMAKSTLPYHHGKVADQGKKGAQEEAARKAVGGRFSTLPTPTSPQGALFQR